MKMKDGRFSLDLRIFLFFYFILFFIQGVARHWNSLPREVMDVPSLEAFETRLDGSVGNLV